LCDHVRTLPRECQTRIKKIQEGTRKVIAQDTNNNHFYLSQVKNQLIALDFCFYLHLFWFYFVGITT